jgi:hypothetical protein
MMFDMRPLPDEDEISLVQTQQVARILAAFDQMESPQLHVLAEGGRLLDDLSLDLWRSVRDHEAIDDFFCSIENKTRILATQHCQVGAIHGNQIFLAALAVQAAIVGILMAKYNDDSTTQLLGSAWLRATQS